MANWIMVVDDDAANLKMAGHILSKNNMRVTALKSGRAMLDYIKEKGSPDLILLDIKMPDLDGFETLDYLRKYENEMGLSETPVIFLTADDTAGTETRGFEVGVSDYIRKPFNPDVLLRRIDNVINVQSEMISLKNDATIDKLTGFLNKEATNVELSKMCASRNGCLMMIDLDSFKLVNDLFGHEMGDKVLITFANIIRENMPTGSKYGRIGGDEFVSFARGVSEESEVAEITKKLNEDLVAAAKEMMGEDMNIPLGTSVGAIMVPKHGNDYPSLLKLADKCLYVVKKNGKHGYSIYSSELMAEEEKDAVTLDIKGISEILGERNITNVAMQLDMEAFSYVYRYATRYFLRNGINACKVLFTLDRSQNIDDEQFKNYCDDFGNFLRESLRKDGILIIDEDMIYEDGKFYNIIKAVVNKKTPLKQSGKEAEKDGDDITALYDTYGEYLIKKKSPVLIEYIEKEIEKKQGIYCRLSKKDTENTVNRLFEIDSELKKLSKVRGMLGLY